MNILRFFSPTRAWRDLRFFLSKQRRHKLVFAGLAALVTAYILFAFWADSSFETPYKEREIIYVDSWPLNRTDAEIIEQQKIDAEKRRAEEAALEAKRRERQAGYQRLDNSLREWGF
ncbi:hypothetical protein [Stakelama tenebrarum]|uniref:Uncharacterized protein n=1 Tax=Stakelama tenebrarum TaxID=2711215 RepID=A0A6G6Y0P6_9SPHN|nr:hypothetical protein [Sphingosinithalassobacter tenebrarum]QIG78495.1 hypothetical protein G5C33_00920 [Sphingosinithalassobacter tenebrarum]